jgi:hypothetical protein
MDFETPDDQTKKLVEKITEEKFPSLAGCVIETIFKTNKSKSKGTYVVAKLDKPTPILKHVYASNNGNELDYILYLDMNVFESLSDEDKELIIKHTLEYADVNMDAKNPYGLRKAEVETFYDIIEQTKEDPRWQQRLQDIAANIYEEE